MLNSFSPKAPSSKMHNSEQPLCKNVHTVPPGCLLIDILKTMEQQFQKRGFLPDPSTQNFHPLWFVATNERNNYLWRNGYSLAQQHLFEFWIDIEALAEKRRQHLSLLKEGFSFTNPAWGLEVPSEENIRLEHAYLSKFLLVTSKIEKHVQALSRAGLLLEQELTASGEERQVVVIPG